MRSPLQKTCGPTGRDGCESITWAKHLFEQELSQMALYLAVEFAHLSRMAKFLLKSDHKLDNVMTNTFWEYGT
jgi:hypothetical protein